MKKTLIISILNLFLFFNQTFATVQKTIFIPQLDSTESPCVKINLVNGDIRYGRVLHLDDEFLTYQPCDKPSNNSLEINVIDVSTITNSDGEILFKNPQSHGSSKYKGRLSIILSLLASIFGATLLVMTLLFFGPSRDLLLSMALVVAPIIGLVTGVAGLNQMKRQPPKHRIWKILAWVSLLASGLMIATNILLRETLRF
jgi:hypothetical protein